MAVSRKNSASASPGRLASWKGIADYFGYNVRTVRRWEQERGLPVHRVPGKKGGAVFAYPAELDAWLKSAEPEHNQHPGALTSEMGNDLCSAAEDDPLPQGMTSQPVAVVDGHHVQQVLLRRWQTWAIAASAALILIVVLFWITKNHRAVFATTSAHLAGLNVRQHVPAPGAENLYLQGRYFWNLRTAEGLTKALDAYTQAVVKDPSYAEAYAGLAETYDLLPQFGKANLAQSLAEAKNAADRAIELNPNLADAHAAKAFALFYGNWDIIGSDAEFRRALALNPNSAETHHWYASTLHDRMEGAECLKQIADALRLNPTSASIQADAAFFQADFGDLDSGMRRLEEIEQTQPNLATPPDFLRAIDFAIGDYSAYVVQCRRFASITRYPNDVALADAVARGWKAGGKTGLLEEQARVLKVSFDRGSDRGFILGRTLLLLGRRNAALRYFRADLENHDLGALSLLRCPWAENLADDPGYAALFAAVRKRFNGTLPARPTVPISLRLPE